MNYRQQVSRLAISKHDTPEDEYILLSDVMSLINNIESDFNSLKDAVVSYLDDIKYDTEKKLEEMSRALY